MTLYIIVEKHSMHDYLFFLFLPAATRYLLLRSMRAWREVFRWVS